ncbi:MAG: hypothetical protein AAB263_16915 [Planctomycetota bacterium]
MSLQTPSDSSDAPRLTRSIQPRFIVITIVFLAIGCIAWVIVHDVLVTRRAWALSDRYKEIVARSYLVIEQAQIDDPLAYFSDFDGEVRLTQIEDRPDGTGKMKPVKKPVHIDATHPLFPYQQELQKLHIARDLLKNEIDTNMASAYVSPLSDFIYYNSWTRSLLRP